MGKRGPRPRGDALSVLPRIQEIVDARERPPVSWDRLVLEESDAARFLKMSRSAFRERAAAGEIPRYGDRGGYRYYVYDLLDWLMDRKREA